MKWDSWYQQHDDTAILDIIFRSHIRFASSTPAQMTKWCNSLLLLILLLNILTSFCERDIQCHDPDTGGTTQNKDRKFLLYSTNNSLTTGFGNFLIFFPSAYYFAAVTGRDIILEDNSIIGEILYFYALQSRWITSPWFTFPFDCVYWSCNHAVSFQMDYCDRHDGFAHSHRQIVPDHPVFRGNFVNQYWFE